MTSSLVGSEMCIRDRSRLPCSTGAKLLTRRASGKAAAQILGCVPSQCAVSYTHLTLPTICSV
eukprot:8590742-Prorocentrum_lima.AAC.1